jgi:hypothetical protein
MAQIFVNIVNVVGAFAHGRFPGFADAASLLSL